MKNRDLTLDLLRAVGLICIILAHVNPPELLFQLRTFDVVMMVSVSTISYTEYSKPKPYREYLWSRIKRLLFPTWQFIILIGVVFFLLSLITNTPTPFTWKRLLTGMFTLSCVGYLWIIRVFIYIALINPFVRTLAKIRVLGWGGVFLCYVIYIIIESLCERILSSSLFSLAESTLLNFISYSIIAIAAYKLYHIKTKRLFIIIMIMFAALGVFCFLQGGFIPNVYKYPPREQYVLWGLIVSGLSFALLRKVNIRRLPKILEFISANSLWIYFWHVIMLNLIVVYPQWFGETFLSSWSFKWGMILGFGCLMTYLQNLLMVCLEKHIPYKTGKAGI